MMKLLALAGAALFACALLAAGPVLAGSPFNDQPGVAVSVGEALGPNYDLWAWVSANVVPAVDQGVLWLTGLVVAWAGVKARAWFGITISAAMQEQLRQTALTGAHLAIAATENEIDHAGLVSKAVAWMQQREPAIIRKLGLSDDVLSAIATKMIASALAAHSADAARAAPVAPTA